LEDAGPFSQIRISAPDTMRLLGGVDQQKEEGEGARGDGALLYAEPVDPPEHVVE
jgi:hypothetical protein